MRSSLKTLKQWAGYFGFYAVPSTSLARKRQENNVNMGDG